LLGLAAQNNIKAAKEHYQLAISQLGEDSKLIPLIQIKLNDLN
jgi:predicted negative regulator of RcsB-dependent stress response